MQVRKRGVVPTYYKIIYDGKVVAVYMQSKETEHLRTLAALKYAYKSVATCTEYSRWIQAQKGLLREIVKPAQTGVLSLLVP